MSNWAPNPSRPSKRSAIGSISGKRSAANALTTSISTSPGITDDLVDLLAAVNPQGIIHFAEQRAAPYSMKTPNHKRYTVDNNINGTHNVLCAIVESGQDIHLVHLGTMGVYGYGTAGMAIPEGYLDVKVDVEGTEVAIDIPYPPHPGCIYHMTKTLDALLFYYYNKNDGSASRTCTRAWFGAPTPKRRACTRP